MSTGVKQVIILTSLAVIVALVGVQLMFVRLLDASANRLETSVLESLSINARSSDVVNAAQFFRALERNQMIACARLYMVPGTGDVVNIYQSLGDSSCQPSRFGLVGVRREVSVPGAESVWRASFVATNSVEHVYLLWTIRVLSLFLVVAVGYVFALRLRHEANVKRQIDRHIRGIAHDLMSPLGSLKVVLSDLTHLQKPAGLRLLQRASERILNIAESLLDGEKSTLPDELPRFDLVKYCEQVVEEKIEALAFSGNRSMEITWEERLSLPGELYALGDVDKFQRILGNLINNAVEASLGSKAEAKVWLSLKENKNFFLVQVADNGHGFSSEELRLLGRKKVASSKTNGHGIGLFLAAKDLQAWGGELCVDHRPEGGALVELRLRKA